jgi:uncharacterized protein (TIGR02186 family)
MNRPIFTKFSIALIMLFLLAPHAYGTALIIDSSTSEVKVSSSFIGTDVMVFGTANDKDDIIVVITGPTETAIVRKKGRVSGIWINKEKLEFREIPGFYAIASTRPLSEITETDELKKQKIGIHNVITTASLNSKDENIKTFKSFKDALVRGQKTKGLYLDMPLTIDVVSKRLFKTTFHFPNNMTTGIYTVKVFSFQKKRLVSMVSKTISVEKIGIGADVFKFAKEQSALYGLLAILIAVLSGWIASVIFRKI